MIVYNRPERTRTMVESLQHNQLAGESDLFVFSDAAKDENDEVRVRKVRDYIKTIDGFHSLLIVERQEHMGLARSVISAVTQTVRKYGRVIVIEDDLECAPFILDYFNAALERYKEEKKVFTIAGFCFPTLAKDIEMDHTYFLRLFNPWSWATWADRWEQFDPNASGWQVLSQDRRMRGHFDFDNTYKYSRALEEQMTVGIDSWAIRWYWSIYKKNGLNLFPCQTLARNLGFDGSGTHKIFVTECLDVLAERKFAFDFPDKIEENLHMRSIVVSQRKKRNLISLKDAKARALDSIAEDLAANPVI